MEISSLERFNTWWRSGRVNNSLLQGYRRHLFSDIQKYISLRQAILIYGLRRVGKSTLLYQMINDLLATVEPHRILYFSFDDKRYDLEDVLDTYQKMILHSTFDIIDKKVYIFFDEIQKVEDWESKIKVNYDLYPNVKFFLSGSASIALRKGAKESLAGRIFDFVLDPLKFTEFLEMNHKDISKIKKEPELWQREITPLFYKYIKFGAFPELVTVKDEEIARKYINEDVIQKIIYKDLPQVFGPLDIELLRILTEMVARSPGILIDYASLGKSLKRDQRTIANYLEYLEFGMIIKMVFNYRGSHIASRRKLKKVYLTTPNITFATAENIDRAMPYMLENMIMLSSKASFFYKNSFEVDFVKEEGGKITGIEVKSNSTNVKQLINFKREFDGKIKELLLITNKEEMAYKEIKRIQAWRYCLFNE